MSFFRSYFVVVLLVVFIKCLTGSSGLSDQLTNITIGKIDHNQDGVVNIDKNKGTVNVTYNADKKKVLFYIKLVYLYSI